MDGIMPGRKLLIVGQLFFHLFKLPLVDNRGNVGYGNPIFYRCRTMIKGWLSDGMHGRMSASRFAGTCATGKNLTRIGWICEDRAGRGYIPVYIALRGSNA